MAPPTTINFRPTEEVAAALERVSEADNRSRSNMINFILGRVLIGRRAAWVVQKIVEMIYQELERESASTDVNYLRGGLWGAKFMLEHLLGEAAKERALEDVRATLQRPIPSIVPTGPDGQPGFGVDMDAG